MWKRKWKQPTVVSVNRNSCKWNVVNEMSKVFKFWVNTKMFSHLKDCSFGQWKWFVKMWIELSEMCSVQIGLLLKAYDERFPD